MNPVVSVVIPVRNAEHFVEAAVRSILDQTFVDLEVLIVDDGSSDRSREICVNLAKIDRRIQILDSQGVGISAALNQGIEEARGGLIARMDADDIAYPDRIQVQTAFLAANPSVAVVGGSVRTIGPLGEPLGEWRYATTPAEVASRMEQHCAIPHPTVVMRTDVIRELGGYRTALDGSEDYDLWLRIIDFGADIDNVSQVVLDHRLSAPAEIVTKRNSRRLNRLAAQVSHRLRQHGVPQTFADAGLRIDPAHMWNEVPEELCLDLRLQWALWQRDGLVDVAGWDLESAIHALLAAHQERPSGDEIYNAFRLLAADARGRRDFRAIRWYSMLFRSSPSRTIRSLLLRQMASDSVAPTK